MGFIFSKSMNENMKTQQEFMLMNSRLQLERQLTMQNEMRERQMAMQIAWSREFLKYLGTFCGIAAVSLTAGAIKKKKPAFLFPIVPLGFVLTYQYDMGYGTLIQRMKELSHCNRYVSPHKPKIVTVWPFQKVCQPTV
ncbi:plasminogen receptor (KT) isoform X3 [Hippopotamus amphibius kiboko]|uniref:plasminogen receptor (KT) isoform X3 n=1 Tax=Hippopotamus amphibius kiboko TaxID=575201 RepID=UPI002592FC3D|nr:plasminogen receptor (KT) isoform X3 [Hippopotamus amphibius kiboko]